MCHFFCREYASYLLAWAGTGAQIRIPPFSGRTLFAHTPSVSSILQNYRRHWFFDWLSVYPAHNIHWQAIDPMHLLDHFSAAYRYVNIYRIAVEVQFDVLDIAGTKVHSTNSHSSEIIIRGLVFAIFWKFWSSRRTWQWREVFHALCFFIA